MVICKFLRGGAAFLKFVGKKDRKAVGKVCKEGRGCCIIKKIALLALRLFRRENGPKRNGKRKCLFLLGEIYYDNSATTKTREESAKLVYEMLTSCYGNPSSLHKKGFEAQQRLELARSQMAQAIGCQPGELYFTSGGTESDNIAILGAARAQQRVGKRIVTTAIEHDAVLHTVDFLESEGWDIVRLKPDSEGKISVQQVLEAVNDQTVLVSMMAVNNEVGSILPVGAICRQLRKQHPRLLIHCDAVQAFGKETLKVGKNLDVDFLTVSGHKIYAPKGCGALYIKKGSRFRPVTFGGGQEKNVRPGTEPIANLCAMGLAANLLMEEREENHKKVTTIRDALLEGLTKLPDICINSPVDATPYILNFSVLGIRSEIMLHFLEEKGIYVSSGSACAKGEPSHVLRAMNLTRERADSAIRLSFGRYNTLDEVPAFLQAVQEAIGRFRR